MFDKYEVYANETRFYKISGRPHNRVKSKLMKIAAQDMGRGIWRHFSGLTLSCWLLEICLVIFQKGNLLKPLGVGKHLLEKEVKLNRSTE